MIFGIIGGRTYDKQNFMFDELDIILSQYHVDKIVSGGANGADHLAYMYAKNRGIDFIMYPPCKRTIDECGFAAAAKERNERIVMASDIIIAFPEKNSRGTWHTVNCAKSKEMEVIIVEEINK